MRGKVLCAFTFFIMLSTPVFAQNIGDGGGPNADALGWVDWLIAKPTKNAPQRGHTTVSGRVSSRLRFIHRDPNATVHVRRRAYLERKQTIQPGNITVWIRVAPTKPDVIGETPNQTQTDLAGVTYRDEFSFSFPRKLSGTFHVLTEIVVVGKHGSEEQQDYRFSEEFTIKWR